MNTLLYTFLAIQYYDFINIVKVFTIIILFSINKHQKVTYGCNTFLIILSTLVGRLKSNYNRLFTIIKSLYEFSIGSHLLLA